MEVASNVQILDSSETWGPKTYPGSPRVHGPFFAPAPTVIEKTVSFEPIVDVQWVKPSPKPFPSWKAIKSSGAIRMTNYEAESVVTQNLLAGRNGCAVNFYTPNSYSSGTSGVCFGWDDLILHTIWREQGDYHYWSGLMEVEVLNVWDGSATEAMVESTRTAAIAAFKGGYDPLTELAEAHQGFTFFKETVDDAYRIFDDFLTKFSDLRSAILEEDGGQPPKKGRRKKPATPRDFIRSTNRRMRQAGNAWLAYRYAIMPLVYSFEDISDLVKGRANTYQTYRNSEKTTITPPSIPDNGLFESVFGDVLVRSVIKARYSNQFLQSYVANQVQVNPFATAWELIPFSFVFDWFVNVGDFIVATTSSDMSAQAVGCTSVKTRLNVDVTLAHYESSIFERKFLSNGTPCHPAGIRTLSKAFSTSSKELVRQSTREHYVREVLDIDNGASIVLNPSLNWKRWVDSVALSHSLLSNLLRRSKK